MLVVDDQLPFRRAATAVCSMTVGFEVVAEAESGEDAVQQAAATHPDVVLMDINLPGINGIEACRQIRAAQDAVVILLSTYSRDDLPSDARDSGALAYVHKEELTPNVLEDLWAARTTGTFWD
ncbi:MAG TPA: response regulator transcription factor [Acidimicrobiales bacterium]|nr:response regulator transcription factor [Acidimicrobiales bacterium]